MLLALEVRDFVIVEHLSLEFGPGFTVLTGETGAGKSILIDALGLVLGARPEPGVVRAGADRAEISAQFGLPPVARSAGRALAEDGGRGSGNAADPGATGAGGPAAEDPEPLGPEDEADRLGVRAWLEEQGFRPDDDTVLVRRSLDAGGRSRCWINGRPATTQQLRAVGAALLDIHGQHAHQSLLRPAAQRELLDAYAGAVDAAAEVRTAWQQRRSLEQQLSRHAEQEQALAAEREQLMRETEDLAAVALTPQAWSELQLEHGRLANAHGLLAAAQSGVERLAEGEGDVLSALHGVAQQLTSLETVDASLRPARELIENAAIALGEAAHELRRYASGMEADPERLAAVEEQMQRVLRCARRYRLAPETMGERLAELRARLDALGGAASRTALEQALQRARRDYDHAARTLGRLRAAGAERLGGTVTATIRALAMGEGVFSVALRPLEDGSLNGSEQVEFCLSAFPGQPAGPLARIASGGELSRVSLAVQTALSQVARVPTLIFDEVDTGIGGRVAEIVGRLLHQLSADCQVMCVTHLAQVAACADHHLLVARQPGVGVPVSRITALDGQDRVDEIARMLGGLHLTDTSRQHARELMAGGQAAR